MCGQQIQYVISENSGPILNKKGQRCIQCIVGTFLYYGRAVEPTILPALNEISTFQAKPTDDTVKQTNILLNYMYTYPAATL